MEWHGVNVVCTDLLGFGLMRQSLYHSDIRLRWVWRFVEAVIGFLSNDMIALSSS